MFGFPNLTVFYCCQLYQDLGHQFYPKVLNHVLPLISTLSRNVKGAKSLQIHLSERMTLLENLAASTLHQYRFNILQYLHHLHPPYPPESHYFAVYWSADNIQLTFITDR